jgi:hypothetical protein
LYFDYTDSRFEGVGNQAQAGYGVHMRFPDAPAACAGHHELMEKA